MGLTVQALRSESDTYPGIGRDAQDVINRELGDRYDILLGIMSARFGTPTERASSGTEEEFDRALQRYEYAPESVAIMMYIKDVEISRDRESLIQAIKVEEFRERLESKGVYYKKFRHIEDFKTMIDIDLTLCDGQRR